MEQHLLGLVGRGDASKADVIFSSVGSLGLQYHVAALDLGELLDQGARRIAQPRAAHPLGERFPQNIGQEADQDVGEDTILFLMPEGTYLQFILGDAERPFSLGQLDVALPQRGRIDVVQVGSQQITAFG